MASSCTFSGVQEFPIASQDQSIADANADFELAAAEAAAKEAEAELAAAMAAATPAGGEDDAEAELASAAAAAEEAEAELVAAMASAGQGEEAAAGCVGEVLPCHGAEAARMEALTSQAASAQTEVRALRAVRCVDRRLSQADRVVRRRSVPRVGGGITAPPTSDPPVQHSTIIAALSVAHEDCPTSNKGGPANAFVIGASSPLCVVDEVAPDCEMGEVGEIGGMGEVTVSNPTEAEPSEEFARLDAITASHVDSLDSGIEAAMGIPASGMGASRPRPPPLTLVWESTCSDNSSALANPRTGSPALALGIGDCIGSSETLPMSTKHIEISVSTPAPLIAEAARSAALSGDCAGSSALACKSVLPKFSLEPPPDFQCASGANSQRKDQVVTFHMPEMDPDSPCAFADTGSTPSEAARMGDCGGTPDFMSTRSFGHFASFCDAPRAEVFERAGVPEVLRETVEGCQMACAASQLGGSRKLTVHQPLVAVRVEHRGSRARVQGDVARGTPRQADKVQHGSCSPGSSFSLVPRPILSGQSPVPQEPRAPGFDPVEVVREVDNVQHWAIASPPSFSHLVSVMHADAGCGEYRPGPDSLRGALNIMQADVGGTPSSGSATGDTGSTVPDSRDQDNTRASAYVVTGAVNVFAASPGAGNCFASRRESPPCLSHPSTLTKEAPACKNAAIGGQESVDSFKGCMVVHMPSMDPDESPMSCSSPDAGGTPTVKDFLGDFCTADVVAASADRTVSPDLSNGLEGMDHSSIDKISDFNGSTGLDVKACPFHDLTTKRSLASTLTQGGGGRNDFRENPARPIFDWSSSAVDRYKATCAGSCRQEASWGTSLAIGFTADLLPPTPSASLVPPTPLPRRSSERTGTSALRAENSQPPSCGMATEATPCIKTAESPSSAADHLPRPRPRQLLENGEHYTGHWLGSVRHGHGKLEMPGVGTFEGNFVQGKLSGHASVTCENGDMYAGQWRDGQEQGLGVRSYADGSSHEGRWERGVKTGLGRESLADGSSFEGQFAGGLRHGHGTYRSADGSIFEGQFRQDKFDGVGRYTFPDGQVYSGQWSRSRMHGEGSMRWPSGMAYDGQFQNDRKEGEGRFSWPGGRVYCGQFKAGVIHGDGTVYCGQDRRCSWTGTWEGGQRTRSRIEVESESALEAPGASAHATLPIESATSDSFEAPKARSKKGWRFSFSKAPKLPSNFSFRRPRIALCGLLRSTPSVRSRKAGLYAPRTSQSEDELVA